MRKRDYGKRRGIKEGENKSGMEGGRTRERKKIRKR